MPAADRRVVITQRLIDPGTIAFLEEAGCEVVLSEPPAGGNDSVLSEDDLAERLAGAAGWIVGHANVTRALLARLPALQVISRRGVGYDRVDVDGARELGKVACIAVGGNHASVADHTLALLLAVGHRLRETQAAMAAGRWAILSSNDLYQRTVGVVGLGRIGRAVVQRLRGFEAEILVCTPTRDPAWAATSGVTYADLDTLLARSDYLTLHAPMTPATRHLIDADALARMRPGAYLINTGRGGLVDDAALLDALEAGRLAGAALDVFESESDPALAPVTAALIARADVVTTPHAAASSQEGLVRTNMVAATCVVDVLDGRDPPAACVIADGRTRG